MAETDRWLLQSNAPLADALEDMLRREYVPFDVPGHKANIKALTDFFGDRCVALDFNSRYEIDNPCSPSGVIMQAERLAADAFGAENAVFITSGTTAAVQTMIMAACSQGDKIILPRNVHVSALNAVILSGAVPVYINPGIHETLGISLGITAKDVEACIKANTDAKAIFVNNPTYYGICSDLKSIVEIAHSYSIPVIVDEAHGTHFCFSDKLPPSAMQCGADMAALSMHKTGGSLTQSSLLLAGKNVDIKHLRSVVNLMRTSSSSYLLLASLDIARRNLVSEGKSGQDRVIALADYARKKISEISGINVFGENILDGKNAFEFDKTKLCINATSLGLAGIELYELLRSEYRIQVEFGDINNILAVITVGDTKENIDRLICALKDIAKKYSTEKVSAFRYEYISPTVRMSPRKAYYMQHILLPIDECEGRISGDFVMCYPPGIPLLSPGEVITEDIISHIKYANEKGCQVTGIDGKEDRVCVTVVY